MWMIVKAQGKITTKYSPFSVVYATVDNFLHFQFSFHDLLTLRKSNTAFSCYTFTQSPPLHIFYVRRIHLSPTHATHIRLGKFTNPKTLFRNSCHVPCKVLRQKFPAVCNELQVSLPSNFLQPRRINTSTGEEDSLRFHSWIHHVFLFASVPWNFRRFLWKCRTPKRRKRNFLRK